MTSIKERMEELARQFEAGDRAHALAQAVNFLDGSVLPSALARGLRECIQAEYCTGEWHREQRTLIASWRRARKVIELVRTESKGRTGKGGTVSSKPGFAPLVQYQVDGTTYRIQGHVSSSSPSYTVGEGVVILYSADNPAEGRIDSFTEKWLVPIIFGGSGLLFTLIGFGMLLWRRRRAPLQPA